MLTVNEAKKKGIRACIEKIGYDFCKQHADNATSAYGENDGVVYCFVGVSDEPAQKCDITKVDRLVLTSRKEWPYVASCNVNMSDGCIDFIEVRRPNGK
jgi:hypothetical protein